MKYNNDNYNYTITIIIDEITATEILIVLELKVINHHFLINGITIIIKSQIFMSGITILI